MAQSLTTSWMLQEIKELVNGLANQRLTLVCHCHRTKAVFCALHSVTKKNVHGSKGASKTSCFQISGRDKAEFDQNPQALYFKKSSLPKVFYFKKLECLETCISDGCGLPFFKDHNLQIDADHANRGVWTSTLM